MSSTVRTVVETALVAGWFALVVFGCWAIEKYESRRTHPERRAARRAIHAAYCDQRGIRTLPALSTAIRPPVTDGTFPKGLDRAEPGPAPGRAGQRRPSH